MQRTGIAELPLHAGECPSWLFSRMKALGRAVSEMIILEYGTREFLKRISDPFFFQSLGCALGFDWHSSGLTTTLTAALKEGIPSELGIVACGGKGGASRKTPLEIKSACEKFNLSEKAFVRASRLSAKVDNSLVQDGYQLYHHAFFLDENGNWAVVQQGMQSEGGFARRYHWSSEGLREFVEEPHSGIAAMRYENEVLDLASRESREARKTSLDLAKDGTLLFQASLKSFLGEKLSMPARHSLRFVDLSKQSREALRKAYELQPESYEELLELKGIGARVLRALALISELCYGSRLSWRDPAKYSWALGGKDGWPYRVNRKRYDETIELLQEAISSSKIGKSEKLNAIKRLNSFLTQEQKSHE